MATTSLVENKRTEIDSFLVGVGMNSDEVDVNWPSFFCGKSVRRGIPAELGSNVEDKDRELLLRPGLNKPEALS